VIVAITHCLSPSLASPLGLSPALTKGDGNINPDTQRVKRTDVVGKVVFVLPYIGQFLTPKSLFTLIPFIFILWLVIDRIKND
jgi:hypothetical protein